MESSSSDRYSMDIVNGAAVAVYSSHPKDLAMITTDTHMSQGW